MAIKRRAAPKLFRTRKLANGPVVQIRAGGQADAKMFPVRGGRLDSFPRKGPDQYQHSPYPMMQYTPTFYHSADGRYGQEMVGSPQWAFGSYAPLAVEPSRLNTPQQGNVAAGDPNRYVSETVMNSLRMPSDVKPLETRTPLSAMEIIQSIPAAPPQAAPPSHGWWMNVGAHPGTHSLEAQVNQAQGMPLLSWTTPASPSNVLPFRDRWNSGSSPTVQGRTSVFCHDLANNREVFCTAPVTPLHAGQPLQASKEPNTGTGYPMTPQDVKIVPADFQFVKAPQEQTYVFSQEEHTFPFSAVETSFPSFEHTDMAVPATADVYLGSQRRPDTAEPSFQDIWPVNVMGTVTAKPLPLPSYSPEVLRVEDPAALPYAKTFRYAAPAAPPVIYPNGQGV